MLPVHTTIFLDTRRALKDGKYPVKLRLTYQRQRKYFNMNYTLTEEDFAKTQGDKPRGQFNTLRIAFNAVEQKAIDIIKKLPVFTFESFEKQFYSSYSKDDVFAAFSEKVAQLLKEDRPGTSESYLGAKKSLMKFSGKKELPFSTVTPDFLREYEQWMLIQQKSPTTVGIYLRSLRALFNDAIADGNVNEGFYPFGKRKYQIPAGRSIKKALSLSEINKLFNYEPKQNTEARSRDYWIFSYLCNGINVRDIARLKYKQLSREQITFVRAKTERTTKQNIKTITASRSPEIDLIIEKWGNKPSYPDQYVFPILTDGLTVEKELAIVKQATKTINKYIKRIAKEIGLDSEITTYTARHSFATVMKRAGVPTAFISESLGHSTERTTQNYLGSFEEDIRKEFAAKLTDF